MTEEKLPQKVNLLGFDAEGLKKFCEDLGEKPFRAKQLERWIHRRGARDFSEMTDLAKSFRAKLEKVAEIRGPEIIRDKTAADELVNGCLTSAAVTPLRWFIFLRTAAARFVSLLRPAAQ